MNVIIKCRVCGATSEFVSADTVLADAGINSFSVIDGKLVPEFDGDSEVYWDTQEPADPDKPYECKGCMTKYSDSELLALAVPHDADSDQDDDG